jgi:hypothetical protein
MAATVQWTVEWLRLVNREKRLKAGHLTLAYTGANLW